jgi:hypothetical protein
MKMSMFEDLERQVEHEYGERKSAVSGWSDKPKKLIDIINKVLGTNTNATRETAPEPEESYYILNYNTQNTQEWESHFIMIRAADCSSAVRTLLSSRSDIKHFRCECKIEDIIQDSQADNLVYVEYTDAEWNYHYVAINAEPENVLGLLVGRYPQIKGAHIQNKIDEVIA